MIIDTSKYCPVPGAVNWECERCQWIREKGCCFNGMTKTEMRHLMKLYGKRVQNESKKMTAEHRIEEANSNLEFWETVYSNNAVSRIEEEQAWRMQQEKHVNSTKESGTEKTRIK